uniref:Uncharacterized protein n=1 Tax=Arundo donax TaxID=35708 RepID=A0A0A9F7W1_ARUDO
MKIKMASKFYVLVIRFYVFIQMNPPDLVGTYVTK